MMFMTPQQAAEMLGMKSGKQVRNYINAGLLPAIKTGSGKRVVYLIRADDLAAFTRPHNGWQPGKPRQKKDEIT